MVRIILYFKAALIGGHRTTLIKESWVSLISEHAVYKNTYIYIFVYTIRVLLLSFFSDHFAQLFKYAPRPVMKKNIFKKFVPHPSSA